MLSPSAEMQFRFHCYRTPDMQTMMKHCARMRQETSQGHQLAPDMQKMMAQCDQMDRGMTMGAPGAAPAATLSR